MWNTKQNKAMHPTRNPKQRHDSAKTSAQKNITCAIRGSRGKSMQHPMKSSLNRLHNTANHSHNPCNCANIKKLIKRTNE
jgi:hypothetical protein